LPGIEKPETIAGEEPRVKKKGGNECILFVDDEDMIVELNEQRLSQFGYHIIGTTKSAEVLRIFREQPNRFHLVITNYAMPDMNGLDLAKRLLKVRADIPIFSVRDTTTTSLRKRSRKPGSGNSS